MLTGQGTGGRSASDPEQTTAQAPSSKKKKSLNPKLRGPTSTTPGRTPVYGGRGWNSRERHPDNLPGIKPEPAMIKGQNGFGKALRCDGARGQPGALPELRGGVKCAGINSSTTCSGFPICGTHPNPPPPLPGIPGNASHSREMRLESRAETRLPTLNSAPALLVTFNFSLSRRVYLTESASRHSEQQHSTFKQPKRHFSPQRMPRAPEPGRHKGAAALCRGRLQPRLIHPARAGAHPEFSSRPSLVKAPVPPVSDPQQLLATMCQHPPVGSSSGQGRKHFPLDYLEASSLCISLQKKNAPSPKPLQPPRTSQPPEESKGYLGLVPSGGSPSTQKLPYPTRQFRLSATGAKPSRIICLLPLTETPKAGKPPQALPKALGAGISASFGRG